MFRKPTAILASAVLLLAVVSPHALRVAAAPTVVSDSSLGISLSLPAGWVQAPAGKFAPGILAFEAAGASGADADLRLAIEPLGTTATTDALQASASAAGTLTRSLAVSVTRSQVTIAGTPATQLDGVPGAQPNVQVILAHDGALYDVVAFGGSTLAPDQQLALASLGFVPRSGPLPSAAPSTLTAGGTRSIPSLPPGASGAQPQTLPGGQTSNVFWFYNASAPSNTGNLPAGQVGAAWPFGYFYGQGDHTGINNTGYTNDYYAIDWPLYVGNSVWAQNAYGTSATVKYAGWSTGGWSGYGIMVVLAYPSGLVGLYAHLSGTSVSVNQSGISDVNQIGTSGCTGNCYGAHVHVAEYSNGVNFSGGQPYGGNAQIPTPLSNFHSPTQVWNSLSQGTVVNFW